MWSVSTDCLLLYFHVEESNIFVDWSKTGPPLLVTTPVISRTCLSDCCPSHHGVTWWHDNRAEQGSRRRSKVCSARCERSSVCTDVSVLQLNWAKLAAGNSLLIPPHWYQSDTNTTIGIDIIALLTPTLNWNSYINLHAYHKTYLFPTLNCVWIPVSSVTLLSPFRDFLPALICALWAQTAGFLCTMEKLKLIWSVWRLGPIVMLWCHRFTG